MSYSCETKYALVSWEFLIFFKLTNYIEGDEMTHFGFRADLTLVLAGISSLDVLDLQSPRICVFHQECLETVISYEGVSIDGENVSVSFPDP